MTKVISIYEARTNLSKYVKQAEAGQVLYIGAYGKPQAVLAPLPVHQPVQIGVWAEKKRLGSYEYEELVGSAGETPELEKP